MINKIIIIIALSIITINSMAVDDPAGSTNCTKGELTAVKMYPKKAVAGINYYNPTFGQVDGWMCKDGCGHFSTGDMYLAIPKSCNFYNDPEITEYTGITCDDSVVNEKDPYLYLAIQYSNYGTECTNYNLNEDENNYLNLTAMDGTIKTLDMNIPHSTQELCEINQWLCNGVEKVQSTSNTGSGTGTESGTGTDSGGTGDSGTGTGDSGTGTGDSGTGTDNNNDGVIDECEEAKVNDNGSDIYYDCNSAKNLCNEDKKFCAGECRTTFENGNENTYCKNYTQVYCGMTSPGKITLKCSLHTYGFNKKDQNYNCTAVEGKCAKPMVNNNGSCVCPNVDWEKNGTCIEPVNNPVCTSGEGTPYTGNSEENTTECYNDIRDYAPGGCECGANDGAYDETSCTGNNDKESPDESKDGSKKGNPEGDSKNLEEISGTTKGIYEQITELRKNINEIGKAFNPLSDEDKLGIGEAFGKLGDTISGLYDNTIQSLSEIIDVTEYLPPLPKIKNECDIPEKIKINLIKGENIELYFGYWLCPIAGVIRALLLFICYMGAIQIILQKITDTKK
jgi:hypothetical protein